MSIPAQQRDLRSRAIAVPAAARGLAGFYVAFGVTLAGFVLASNVLGLAKLLHLRHRFWLLGGASAAIGTLAAIIAGPLLGAVPAPVIFLALTLTLLAAAAAFTTKLLGAYLGPVGLPIATLVLLTVGNATSGAVIGADLLPSAARAVSALLPPGAAVRAIRSLSYFGARTRRDPSSRSRSGPSSLHSLSPCAPASCGVPQSMVDVWSVCGPMPRGRKTPAAQTSST